ncbi:uncharacterized protein [Penaeus vannamei]|uniref:uncharacterized protein n=1 Tax=Penaeus vannamei TaxID=6689 RepID=UPI00387F61AA
MSFFLYPKLTGVIKGPILKTWTTPEESFQEPMQAWQKCTRKRGVKQGCVLAPTLFGLCFCVFKITHSNLGTSTGVSVLSRDDGNFFNLSRFTAKTRIQRVVVQELLSADDAALCASTPEQLQDLLDCFTSACEDFGLTISLKKTVTMSPSDRAHAFTINDTTLDDVEKFTYLGSIIAKNTSVDQDICTRLGKAATTFGRLTNRVWKNKTLSIRTKVQVYEACVLSILLYGTECWATYLPQESNLSAFHTANLRFILGKTWADRMTDEDISKITGSGPLSLRLKFTRLPLGGACTPNATTSDSSTPTTWCFGAWKPTDRKTPSEVQRRDET